LLLYLTTPEDILENGDRVGGEITCPMSGVGMINSLFCQLQSLVDQGESLIKGLQFGGTFDRRLGQGLNAVIAAIETG
jgi:hypothetical protein